MCVYIVNGRLIGDSYGRYTYSSPLGKSSSVRPLTHLSDHSQMTMYLKRAETNNTATQSSKLYNIHKPCRWAQNNTDEYQKAIENQEIQSVFDTFLDIHIHILTINTE